MNREMTRFSDAVYTRRDCRGLRETIFSRRELKVLLLVDGQRTVTDIAELIHSTPKALMPEFGKLVQLGLIQTEGGIVTAEMSALVYPANGSSGNSTLSRLPHTAAV